MMITNSQTTYNESKKVLIICGPTATGKTDLAIKLAKKFNGELISCDSRQVYKGLDIGTGKLPNDLERVEKGIDHWVVDGVPIWMYDVADPNIRFTVVDYIEKVRLVIVDILNREKLPIIVGGTGLYLQGLISGFDLSEIPSSHNRSDLENLSVEQLQKKLSVLSPAIFDALNNSDKNNPRRLIRKIEILESCHPELGSGSSNDNKNINLGRFRNEFGMTISILNDFNILKIGLSAPRLALNNLIDKRAVKRVDQGMIEEAVKLHNDGLTISRMNELGLEYRLLSELITHKITKEEFIAKLKIKIHQYAKRQMTWFKRDKNINWFDITQKNWERKVDKLTSTWYNTD